MKQTIKRWLSAKSRDLVSAWEVANGTKLIENEAAGQKLLLQRYREFASTNPSGLPSFEEAGFRKYSQFEEDGILLLLFGALGVTNKVCVEICAGNGRECMCSNLIINHGWNGYLFDGNERNVARGRDFFARCPDTFLHPPAFNRAWITAENVNETIRSAGAEGPVDLFSLDIDGMDYWVWKALEVIRPRVVVCETHNLIPAGHALTVPYEANFVCQDEEFRSASLAAMCKLANSKGYRLVGVHRHGFNAFFVERGLGEELFPEIDCAECLNDPYTRKVRAEHWARVQKLPWQSV